MSWRRLRRGIISSGQSNPGGDPPSHTPVLVENFTNTASYDLISGSFASDSSYWWFAMVVNFRNDGSTEQFFDCGSRCLARRQSASINVQVKNTSATMIFEGNSNNIAKAEQHHVYFAFDGVAGTANIYVDGVSHGWSSIPTAATTGTVDHTRSDHRYLQGLPVNAIGDFLIGSTAPPAVSTLYDSGYKDVSGVTAVVKIIGNAATWNAYAAHTGDWVDV